jgi:hypothetical protein
MKYWKQHPYAPPFMKRPIVIGWKVNLSLQLLTKSRNPSGGVNVKLHTFLASTQI